ncbi:MAG: DUF2236 domain-containing protein [Actinomycetota bacterium]|nr:DUF2236 domain-containing protein [Actinomycetota bacterium]
MNGTLFPTGTEAERLLVGPESMTWRSASDARLYLVMLYPLLLQVAHPTVGAGVRDFSDFEQRPWDRLLRTLDYVSLIVYGGPDAIATGRRLRAMHKGFTGVREDGERYYALEPEAYAWVHATLLESYVAGHAHFGRPMSRPEVDAFYREYRGLGRLLGVRERDLPETWEGFREYFDAVVANELVRTESVDRVIRSVKNAANPLPPIPDPLWRVLRLPASYSLWVGGVGLMAPELRGRLGIEFSRAEALAFRGLGTFSRALTPLMPKRLLITGPGQLRLRRRAIAHGPLGRDARTGPRSSLAA